MKSTNNAKDYRLTNTRSLMLLLRRLQQKNRFVSFDFDSKLTILQSFLLLEIDSGRCSANELAQLFNVDQSTISRHLSALTRQKLIRSRPTASDERRRTIEIAAAGLRFLKQYDQLSDQQLAAYCSLLTEVEINEFTIYFSRLNTGLQAPTLINRKTDQQLRVEMRRIVFALGVFEQSFMGTGVTVAAWQVLSELTYRAEPLSQSELAKYTGVTQSSLPAIIARLKSSGLIKVCNNPKDARSVSIYPHAEANSIVERVEQILCQRLEQATSIWSQLEFSRFIFLFERFVGETIDGNLLLPEDYSIRFATTEKDRVQLRKLTARFILSTQIDDFPANLFTPDSTSVGIYFAGELVGAGEFYRDGSNMRLENVVLPETISPAAFTAIIKIVGYSLDIQTRKSSRLICSKYASQVLSCRQID